MLSTSILTVELRCLAAQVLRVWWLMASAPLLPPTLDHCYPFWRISSQRTRIDFFFLYYWQDTFFYAQHNFNVGEGNGFYLSDFSQGFFAASTTALGHSGSLLLFTNFTFHCQRRVSIFVMLLIRSSGPPALFLSRCYMEPNTDLVLIFCITRLSFNVSVIPRPRI